MVKPKKYLGQHFLKDQNIAKKIVECFKAKNSEVILEIGPGTGVLTKYLIQRENESYFMEIDRESVDYLKTQYPEIALKIIFNDILKQDLSEITQKQIAVIGNFPYNISSRILFKVMDNKAKITELVGMFQKEVAERIVSKPGSKVYGILSVLIQAFYDAEYLFTVNENVFDPPPKVKSGVIRLTRKENFDLNCNETLFFKIVKTAFNQRRKVLRNSLKVFQGINECGEELMRLRPEQLSFRDFIFITRTLENFKH
jgi:16S rRNA (adenine1518-N6/adenine1519-N6)-dimethyltransferase